MEFKFSAHADDYPEDHEVASSVIKELTEDYRDKSLFTMLRFSRGSVLIQNARILSKHTLDAFFKK